MTVRTVTPTDAEFAKILRLLPGQSEKLQCGLTFDETDVSSMQQLTPASKNLEPYEPLQLPKHPFGNMGDRLEVLNPYPPHEPSGIYLRHEDLEIDPETRTATLTVIRVL